MFNFIAWFECDSCGKKEIARTLAGCRGLPCGWVSAKDTDGRPTELCPGCQDLLVESEPKPKLEPEVLPCKMCGARPVEGSNSRLPLNSYHLACTRCGISVDGQSHSTMGEAREKAIQVWNRLMSKEPVNRCRNELGEQ